MSEKHAERFSENPFKDDLVIIPKRVRMTGVDENRIIRDNDSGLEAPLKFSYNVVREESNFVKVYKENIKQMFDLSNTSMKLFWFACSNLKTNNDVVNIERDEFMSWAGYKNRKSFHDGINELIEKKILARTEKDDWYYVNLAVFFSGSRLRVETVYYKQ
jgi:hypothetical protein